MLARPRAMPSLLASPRWVTRESSCTASSSRRSRCASTSMAFTCSGLCWAAPKGRRLFMVVMVVVRAPGEGLFRFGPVVEVVDADGTLRRHRIGNDAIAIQARLVAEERRSAARVDGAIHDPRLGQV